MRFLAEAGIGQFLDIGSGIPTQGNVHEVAQQARPDARVVYVDVDPVAIAHSKALLAGNENAAIIDADLREPEKILAHPATRRLIDFSQPAGPPARLGAALPQPMPPIRGGSWPRCARLWPPAVIWSLAHATDASRPVVAQAAEKVYNSSVSTRAQMRSREEILRFFDGFGLVDPGLVYVPLWRPDPGADVSGDPGRFWILAGAGRKP